MGGKSEGFGVISAVGGWDWFGDAWVDFGIVKVVSVMCSMSDRGPTGVEMAATEFGEVGVLENGEDSMAGARFDSVWLFSACGHDVVITLPTVLLLEDLSLLPSFNPKTIAIMPNTITRATTFEPFLCCLM